MCPKCHCGHFKVKCPGSPWPEAILYFIGMILLAFGVGILVASLATEYFPVYVWKCLLIVGSALLIIGIAFVILAVKIPEYPTKSYSCNQIRNEMGVSSISLLGDVQSVASSSSPIVRLFERDHQTEESVQAVRQCMMMQPDLSNSGILFVKHTAI